MNAVRAVDSASWLQPVASALYRDVQKDYSMVLVADPPKGKCEINPELPCAWQLIIDRLKNWDRLETMNSSSPLRTGQQSGLGVLEKL